MSTYHKRPIDPPRCGRCSTQAQWIVEGGVTNYWVGQYCDKHADEAIKAQEQYEAGLKKLSQEQGP